MTSLPQMGFAALSPILKDFDKYFVGFEDQYNRISKMHEDIAKSIPNYPPYNIKKTGENTYVIELAVAGFGKQDVEIELAESKLVVKGSTSDNSKDNYLYKGIANRSFSRAFALSDQIEVQDAEMINGMLRIFLEKIIPEHKKPKKIEVKDKGNSASTKQMLVE